MFISGKSKCTALSLMVGGTMCCPKLLSVPLREHEKMSVVVIILDLSKVSFSSLELRISVIFFQKY